MSVAYEGLGDNSAVTGNLTGANFYAAPAGNTGTGNTGAGNTGEGDTYTCYASPTNYVGCHPEKIVPRTTPIVGVPRPPAPESSSLAYTGAPALETMAVVGTIAVATGMALLKKYGNRVTIAEIKAEQFYD